MSITGVTPGYSVGIFDNVINKEVVHFVNAYSAPSATQTSFLFIFAVSVIVIL